MMSGHPRRVRPEFRVSAEFAARLAAAAGEMFHGKISYAALPQEPVDWSNGHFDVIGVNAYYDAHSRKDYDRELRAKKELAMELGKEMAVTEFGTAPYPGAWLLGGAAASLGREKPMDMLRASLPDLARFLERIPGVRTIAEAVQPLSWWLDKIPAALRPRFSQLRHIQGMLRRLERDGADSAFIFEFAERGMEQVPHAERVSLAVTEETRRGLCRILGVKRS